MLELRISTTEEIPLFVAMESAGDTGEFVFGWDDEKHAAEMQKDGILYLSIMSDGNLTGFFILALEPEGETVEFRRIVVADKGKGIGQAAIRKMEEYCREKLGRSKIWLDVMESNERGRHIYEKLGYIRFDTGEQEGKRLLFYRKEL